MNLATEDARLFFKLFFALLAYTNRQLKITPKVSAPSDIPKAGGDALMKMRDALYADSELFVRFIEENPENFAPEELAIIANWKHRVSGEFYLMRYLKKYAVFMPAKKSDHLYGVLGLYDPIEVVVRGQPLPVLLKTTLLPFKGQIIYDGLVEPYTILFGKGIRTDLETIFRRLKAKEGIVEQLVDAEGKQQIRASLKPRAPAPDWKPLIAEMVAQADRMRRADTPIQNATLGLFRATAHLAHLSFERTDLSIIDDLKQVRRAMSRLESALYDEEFE